LIEISLTDVKLTATTSIGMPGIVFFLMGLDRRHHRYSSGSDHRHLFHSKNVSNIAEKGKIFE
jgi:hypothetical protein